MEHRDTKEEVHVAMYYQGPGYDFKLHSVMVSPKKYYHPIVHTRADNGPGPRKGLRWEMTACGLHQILK